MKELKGRIHHLLLAAIQNDITADKDSLGDAGFVFSNEEDDDDKCPKSGLFYDIRIFGIHKS